MSKAAIYADINPNAIDGSSIWMMSITEVLSGVFDQVWLVLKTEPTDRKLVSALDDLPNVILDFPDAFPEGSTGQKKPFELSVSQAANRMEELHREESFDAIVVRGLEACNELSSRRSIAPRLWSYVTDLPFPPSKLSQRGLTRLERIAVRSAGLFAQTESSRAYYEALAPSAPGKVHLLPPMIPDKAFADESASSDPATEKLRLVYAGKFAREWKTFEMLELPAKLAKLGVPSELKVVGAKINRSKVDPQWLPAMRDAIDRAKAGEYQGVEILGALSRDESLAVIESADLGIGWRTSELDSSMELSTKALEYSAAGTPPILNRNTDHESMFSPDYGFFVTADTDVDELARLIVDNRDRILEARQAAMAAVRRFAISNAAVRLKHVFGRSVALERTDAQTFGVTKSATKVLVASHDLKFAGELLTKLNADQNFEVKFDHWKSLHVHDKDSSKEKGKWADTVFCEFAGPNLAYYSNNVGEGQRLIARLHGFEVRNKAKWFGNVDFSKVDKVITVSERYKNHTIEFLPELEGKVEVIPNMIDTHDFDRPKSNDARFHIGLVGMVPFLKRPDRALSVLKALLDEDDRYYLHIKGRMPWEYPYVWEDNLQRHQYLDFFAKLNADEQLLSHTVFDPFSTDIGAWMRGIGVVLSPSDEESFHLAPAEGMASGAVPMVWLRDGAEEIFGSGNVYAEENHIVRRILALWDFDTFDSESSSAKRASRHWDVSAVFDMWTKQLTLNSGA